MTPTTIDENTDHATVQFSGLSPNTDYEYCGADSPSTCNARKKTIKSDSSGTVIIDNLCAAGEHLLEPKSGGCDSGDFFWGDRTYAIKLYTSWPNEIGNASFKVKRVIPSFDITSDNGFKPGSAITAKVKGSRRPIDSPDRNAYLLEITGSPNPSNNSLKIFELNNSEGDYTFSTLSIASGDYTISLTGQNHGSEDGFDFGKIGFKIDTAGGGITSGSGPTSGSNAGVGSNPCGTTCPTALGDLPLNFQELVNTKILPAAIGMAGGIALILMVIGSIRMLMSQGDQQKLNGGREMFVAALAGLLFLIFSTLILRFIGINIIGIK